MLKALVCATRSMAYSDRPAPLTARRRLQEREFWILYYRSSRAVYLALARQEREEEY